MDAEASTWTVSGLLWATAYAGIGLSAVVVPAGREGVEGLLIGGLIVWSVSILLAWPDRPRKFRRTALDSAVYLSAIGLESIAALRASREGQADQSFWFGLAAGFAAAAWAGGRLREPGDGLLFTQLAFHGWVLIPAAALLINAGLSMVAAPGAIGPASPLVRSLIVVASVVSPLVLLVDLAVLAVHSQRPAAERDRPGSTLLVIQSACLVALLRWAYDGI